MGLRGVDGHTAGAYDLAPEALLADGFIRGEDNVYPVLFDEAGHRVALQYAMAAFNGDLAFDLLLKYLFNRAKMKWSATEAMVLLWPLAKTSGIPRSGAGVSGYSGPRTVSIEGFSSIRNICSEQA